MSRGGTEKLLKSLKKVAEIQYKLFTARYGQQIIDILDFTIKLVLSPFTLPFDIAGSAPRGFGVPEFISKLSYASIFAVATLGTYDIALELGKKVICQSGEKPTPESIADAIADNRAELVHLPSTIDLHTPLPCKDCPTCDGTDVMGCPECKGKLHVTISADDIIEPPWKAYNVLRKMDYPYEHIVDSMKDPCIAVFWLFTLPQVMGGFEYDDDVKKKIWWQYKESMRYDQLRDVVAKREPGRSQRPRQAIRDDYPPRRPKRDRRQDFGYSLHKWRQVKLNEMLEEKVRPYIQNIDNAVLSQPIILQSPDQKLKRNRQRKWWIF